MGKKLHSGGLAVRSAAGGRPAPAAQSELALGLQSRAADVAPASINAGSREIEVVVSTGVGVRRYDWETGRYYIEKLSLDPKHIRLDRFNGGAPVLDSHNQWSLSAVLGLVVAGSGRIEADGLMARLKIGEAPDIDPVWARVEQGIITKVSVGYRVYTYQVTRRDGEDPEYLAVDWEPMEVSLVAVPADPDATVRADDKAEKFHVRIVETSGEGAAQASEEDDMKTRSQTGAAPAPQTPPAQVIEAPAVDQGRAAPAQTPAAPPAVDLVAQARAAERERIQQIRSAAGALNLAGDFVDGLINDGVDLDVARARMIDEVARQSRGAHQPARSVQIGEDHSDPEAVRERMVDAIVARATGAAVPDRAREFAGLSMLEMGVDLARARGAGDLGRRMSPAVMYERLEQRTHTTGDFPLLLNAASDRILRAAYERAAPTYRQVMGQRNLPDFKPTKILDVGDFPGLLEVGEEGEYKYGTVGESEETLVLSSYGRILKLSRRSIINDELGAFGRVIASVAGRVSRFENGLAWAVVKKNPKLSDGKAVFHADHGNTAAAAAIEKASLSAGRQAIMVQKDMDGQALNLMPRFLMVGADLLTDAESAVAAITPTKSADYNPFSGRLEVVGDAEIESSSWYLGADPAVAPAFVYSYLEGFEGPRISSREGFTTDGFEWRVALDFGVGAVDYRPWYRRK